MTARSESRRRWCRRGDEREPQVTRLARLSSGWLEHSPPPPARVLETLTAARRYNAWLADPVRPYLGDDPVEIGAGIGTYSALWLEHGVPRLTVTDIHRIRASALGERFDRDPRVTVMPLDLTAPPAGTHSALVALNVLEHIADDVSGLRGGRAARPPRRARDRRGPGVRVSR